MCGLLFTKIREWINGIDAHESSISFLFQMWVIYFC